MRDMSHIAVMMADVLSRWRNRRALSFVGSRILDLGCGRATMLKYLPRDASYTGVEKDSQQVEELRRRYPERRFLVTDLDTGLPDLREGYDTVLLLAVLEHLKNPREVVERCHDLLAPGGKMILSVPTRWGEFVHRALAALRLANPEVAHAHLWRFDARSLLEVFQGLEGEVVDHHLFQLGCNRLLVYRKSVSGTGEN
ncbi:MAG: class I SAM-dependent methyltransferase [Actinomycetota bacterium]